MNALISSPTTTEVIVSQEGFIISVFCLPPDAPPVSSVDNFLWLKAKSCKNRAWLSSRTVVLQVK